MNNGLHRNKRIVVVAEQHLDPPHTPLVKINRDDKSDKDFVKLKLNRDPTSGKSGLYEFKIALFLIGKTEEFLLFVCNFKMTLEASGTLETAAKAQYICTLVCG